VYTLLEDGARRVACGMAVVCGLLAAGSNAWAQVHGVSVQVNEGKPPPTLTQLQTVLNPGDFVHDVVGWHQVDRKCDLRADPSHTIKIPQRTLDHYLRVEQAGGRNFVVLAFNNRHCGQPVNSGAKTFPNTDALRAEFAAYAVGVVSQVPALGGISIWNEFTGTHNGGYAASARAQKLTDYCLLANAVITEVRKVDEALPIAIGATNGANIYDYFFDLFRTYGCMGENDPTVWLDVHPYLATQADFDAWNQNVGQIRAAGITNALMATEWGGRAAYNWSLAHPGGNYVATFEANVIETDAAWAGAVWFLLKAARNFPNAGLYDRQGNTLTQFGLDYIEAYRTP
jgi:hypothetical protein